MKQSLIWLHEEALRKSHPVFLTAPENTQALFIWDDNYFKQRGYSLKRLVFIYETLCTLPITIFQGDILDVLTQYNPSILYIPYSYSDFVQNVACKLSGLVKIEWVDDEPFVNLPQKSAFKRFFQYWKKAEKFALTENGKKHA